MTAIANDRRELFMRLFDINYCSGIFVEPTAAESVLLAVQDLRRDLCRISGQQDGFSPVSSERSAGIIIRTVPGDVPETYTVCIDEEHVRITGSDALGTIYGIYAFSNRCLDVLPTHRFIDIFPQPRQSMLLSCESFSSAPRPVRFRGWFVNDEDLLSEMKDSGARRDLGYAYYRCVMDPEVMDMVIETALRLEYNLIIPGTLIDIMMPAEEKLVETAYRRGMYLSMHHIEPMGVSHFSAEKYLAERSREDVISFASNPDVLEEIWRHYAKKWAKYGDRVVWQLGLRGKKDEAVWKNDPAVPTSWEGRGELVTKAIRLQHKIIGDTLGHTNFYSTATLWNEGSMLYGKGWLRLPENTLPVLADFGIDQMFGDDLFSANKEGLGNYGVYYHTSFWALGPHMCEGCRPEKMSYSYRIAAEKGNLCYSMLNISNVRPMHYSISMNAAILANPAKADIAQIMDDFDSSIFGNCGSEVTVLRKQYYDSFADFGEDLAAQFAKKWFFFYHTYPELPFIRNAATDGQLTWVGKYAILEKQHCGVDYSTKERLPALQVSEKKLQVLLDKLDAVQSALPENTRLYWQQFLKYQTKHLLLLTRWCIACLDMVDHDLPTEQRRNAGREACGWLEKILEERKILELGQWKDWHKGDEKMNIPRRLQETAAYLEAL